MIFGNVKYKEGGKIMVREIKAYFTASDDTEFVPGEDNVILLAPDMTLSIYDNEWIFRFPTEPVGENQDTVEIDLGTCGRVEIYMEDVDVDFIAKASFLDVVRALKK
jgi:hypothetical protein